MAGKVKIITEGRSGKVQYSEGFLKKNTCKFYWEYGSSDTPLTVWFPTEDKWDEAYPWARGRRREILETVAKKVHEQGWPDTTLKWEADRFHIVRK